MRSAFGSQRVALGSDSEVPQIVLPWVEEGKSECRSVGREIIDYEDFGVKRRCRLRFVDNQKPDSESSTSTSSLLGILIILSVQGLALILTHPSRAGESIVRCSSPS